MKGNDLNSKTKMKLYIYGVMGVAILGTIPTVLLLKLIGVPSKGIFIIVLITLVFLFATGVRVKLKMDIWEAKKFYIVRIFEFLLAICVLAGGYVFHFELIASYFVLAIIVIDRLLHIFFRIRPQKGED
jgi:hypothetical protein